MRRDLKDARTHKAGLEAWRDESANESSRIRDLWQLAETAARALPNLGPAERKEVLALLDVRVFILEAPDQASGLTRNRRPPIRIEGSIPHAQLLASLESGGYPAESRP
jgi:hypothetical protein